MIYYSKEEILIRKIDIYLKETKENKTNLEQ